MRELTMNEVQDVNGGNLTPGEGGAATLALIAFAPVGFAMGFGVAIAAGLFYAAYKLQ
jgi:hypothetical protein